MKSTDIFNSELKNLLDKYSSNDNMIGTALEKAIANSNSAEIIVPVLGMQGMGKSTLINAILRENILPNEADETTCIPVEVKYGEEEFATVIFQDTKETLKIYTNKELSEYVDNNFNPANEKQVLKIILYRKNELLRNGLIIVDLPGVGSMTKNNQDTTNHYIENLCTAIFVIPTVPTIRRLEALFIKSVWSQFSTAIFVQNDWGDSEQEKKDSIEFNLAAIKQIAKELNYSFDDNIILVNAYDAIKGAIDGDENLIRKSNINTLVAKINELSASWENSKNNALLKRIYLSVIALKKNILNRIDELNKTQEEIVSKRKNELELFKKGTDAIKGRIDSIRSFLDQKGGELHSSIRKEARDCCSDIRSKIYYVIDSGVVDGPELTDAFNDIQEEASKDFFDKVFSMVFKLKYDLEEQLEELQNLIEIENDIHFNPEKFDNGDSFKFEKAIDPLFDIGGGIGGFIAGTALGGPIGLAVGFGIAIVVGIIGHFIHRGVTKMRGAEAKKQIAPYLDKIEDNFKNEITDKIESFIEQVNEKLQNVLASRKKELQRFESNLYVKEDNNDETSLHSDLEYAEKIINLLGKR